MKPNKQDDEDIIDNDAHQGDADDQDDDQDAGSDDQGDDDEGDSGEGQLPPAEEAKLRKQGWVPKSEWSGDPANWMDPQTFARKREAKTLKRQLDEAHQTIAEIKEYNKTRDERAYKRAMRDIEARKLKAVEEADPEAYKEVEREEKELREDYAPPVKKASNAPPPEVVETVDAWRAENPWYDKDPDLRAAAMTYHGSLGKSNPHLSLSDNLKQTADYIRKIFPDKFEQDTSKRRSPSIEGNRFNSFKPGGGGKAKTAADLPAEARAAGQRFVRAGLFKDLNEYATDYFAE